MNGELPAVTGNVSLGDLLSEITLANLLLPRAGARARVVRKVFDPGANAKESRVKRRRVFEVSDIFDALMPNPALKGIGDILCPLRGTVSGARS